MVIQKVPFWVWGMGYRCHPGAGAWGAGVILGVGHRVQVPFWGGGTGQVPFWMGHKVQILFFMLMLSI